MAYRDIESWAMILESQDEDAKAYDEACAVSEDEDRELDVKEFEDLDEDEIDPNTLGITDSEADDLAEDLEDENEDEIDFSAYGVEDSLNPLNETDGNYTIAAHLRGGVVVDLYPNHFYKFETAEKLVGNSAIYDAFAEYARSQFGDNAVNEIVAADVSKSVGGGKWFDALPTQKQEQLTSRFDQDRFDDAHSNIINLVKSSDWKRRMADDYESRLNEADDREPITKVAKCLGKVASTANLTGQNSVKLNESDEEEALLARIATALEKIAASKQPEPVDEPESLTEEDLDDMMAEASVGDQIDPTVLDKLSDIAGQLAKDEDYPMTDAEWEEFEKIPDDTVKGLGQRWQYLWNKMNTPGISDGAKARLNRLLSTYAGLMQDIIDKPEGYYGKTRPQDVVVPKGPDMSVRRAHHSGEDAEERAAETGLDGEVDISKIDWTPEPMEPGTRTQTQFNPDYRSKHDIAQDVKATLKSKAWKDAERTAMQQIKTKEGFAAAGELAAKDENVALADFVKMLNGIPKAERDELLSDLVQNAQSEDEKRFVQQIFTNPGKIQLKDIGAAFGGGTQQDGKTGMLTEFGDKMINLLLVIMAEFWGVATDEAERMRKIMRSESTANREERKTLRPAILGEIMAELGDNSAVPQPYVMGIMTKGKHKGEQGLVADAAGKKAFDRKVGELFAKTLFDKQVTDVDRQQIHDAIADFKNGSQIRKINSKFDPVRDNAEFQKLIGKARDSESDMTDDEWITLFRLEGLRHGMSEEKAQEAAEELMTNPDPDALKKLKLDDRIVKNFLRGGSGNANI